MNLLKPDAVVRTVHILVVAEYTRAARFQSTQCLANHEFDYGINGLLPYLHATTFPFVAANLNLTKEPLLLNERSLRRSTVVRVYDRRMQLVPSNGIRIADEVAAVI